MIYGSSFYLQLSQASLMLSLGVDPPSPIASSWCFILCSVSGAPHSPFGDRFCTLEGHTVSKPKGSGFCSLLGVGRITAPCTSWLCANKQPAHFLIWELFTVPLSSLEKNNLWLAIIGAPGEQQSCLLKGGKPR